MKQLFSDIIGFVKNLSQVDLLLYFAILVLIILVVSLIYIIKTSDDEEEITESFNNEDIDLNEVVTNIENTDPPTIEFTSYEKEQEEKAIISYEELIAKNKSGAISYNEEEIENGEISIKKIDLDNIIVENEKEIKEEIDSTKLFKYANEEAFLSALKTLNELLN